MTIQKIKVEELYPRAITISLSDTDCTTLMNKCNVMEDSLARAFRFAKKHLDEPISLL